MKELSRSDERVKSYWTLKTHCVLIRLRFPAVIEPSWIGKPITVVSVLFVYIQQ